MTEIEPPPPPPENEKFSPHTIDDNAYLQELYEGLIVVDTKTWLATTVFILFVITIIAWLFLGAIPINIQGMGLLSSNAPQNAVIVAYVPLDKANKIKQGDRVAIELSGFSKFEYGVMRGKVTVASNYPVSSESIKQKVINASLANKLMTEPAGVAEVIVQPNLDTNTESGYQWSTGAGPHAKMTTGLVGQVIITVETVAPIYYLFPLWHTP
jgi:hypothetical protein